MTKDIKLKPYHILFLSCLFCSILILNSNYVNNKRALEKRNKEQEQLFDRLIQKRQLSEYDGQTEYSKEVCSRGSKSLVEYYDTGDLSKIDLKDGKIECKEKDESYMKALIAFVRSAMGDGKDDDGGDYNHIGNGGPYYDDNRLRNLEDDIDTDSLIDYATERLLPMAVFIIIGLLGFIAWPICCFCCCCNCCCCCCLKKSKFKLCFFIFTYAFYALVVAVCIYGLSQANKIFEGLANTECSLLKFFEQVIYGEMKTDLPRWAGISNIKDLLGNLNDTIIELKDNSYSTLNDKMDDITASKISFKSEMEAVGKEFYDGGNYKAPYVKSFPGEYGGKNYVYDSVYMFGRHDGTKYTPDNCFIGLWYQEYSQVSDNAYDHLQGVQKDFQDILDENIDDVQNSLGDGKETLDELLDPFNDANEEIGEIFADYSESIDSYGKMAVNIVFGVLMVMNLLLAALLLLICMFSGKSCTGCCFVRCIFKFCTHILWNVLLLMMIFAFIIGGFVSLIGRVGGDMMSLVTFIMSKENFQDNENALIINDLGEAKSYLERCIQGDGDIAQELNLGDSLGSFDGINEAERNIETAIVNFTNIINNLPAYYMIKNHLEMQQNYSEEVTMIPVPSTSEPIKYQDILSKINVISENKNARWSTEDVNNLACTATLTEGSNYYPKSCKPKEKNDLYKNDNGKYVLYADIINDMETIVDYANSQNSGTHGAPSIRYVIDHLQDHYKAHLNGYVDVLQFFNITINRITSLIRQYTGNGEGSSAFSFLNGKFIGTNLKIILKYLQHSLGGDFFTVGVCLAVVGFSLILSISATILLIIIINIDLEEKKATQNNGGNTGVAVSGYKQPVGPYFQK